MLALLVMSAQMLWPSIKQPKSTQNLADTGMPCAGINDNTFHDITWLAYERNIPSEATTSRPSNLPATKLIYFSNLFDVLKARMHSKHKLGHANPSTCCYLYD